jgi:RNA polymerase sigma factor (sigma-70 family)
VRTVSSPRFGNTDHEHRPIRPGGRPPADATGGRRAGRASDRELVERFVRDRSEGAFADLMTRHGPMVLAVCRRHLRDPHAADDAFQAAFIVLARRAAAVRWHHSIGGWLFGVATRVARKAASRAARRGTRERALSADTPEPAVPPPADASDLTGLQHALDDELRTLPEALRAPVVLCHLEGLSQDEVARHLGITDGQLRGRLYRARERLRERLLRRGFTLSAVLLALAVGGPTPAVPPGLAAGTLRLVVGPDQIPTAVRHLALGVIRDMTATLKAAAALALFGALGLAAAGFAVLSARADGPQPCAHPPAAAGARTDTPAPPAAPGGPPGGQADDGEVRFRESYPLAEVDAVKNVLTLWSVANGVYERDPLGPKTVVRFAGRVIKTADLKPGMQVELVYRHPAEPTEVLAAWPHQIFPLTAIDPAKRAITRSRST